MKYGDFQNWSDMWAAEHTTYHEVRGTEIPSEININHSYLNTIPISEITL